MTQAFPLTYGQLSLWRDVENLPPHRQHEPNIVKTWTLPAEVTYDAVARAFTELSVVHESLRTTYDVSNPGSPTQEVGHPSGELILKRLTECTDEAELPHIRTRPFDLGRAPAWRVAIIGNDDDRRLVTVYHHLVTDGGGLAVLESDLRLLLAGQPVESAMGPSAVSELERSARGSLRAAASLRHWTTVLERASARLPGMPEADTAPLCHVNIASESALDGARSLARASSVSTSDAILSAFLGAAGIEEMDGELTVRLMSSNRFDARRRRVVSTMNQWVPVALSGTGAAGLPELARSVGGRALAAYRHGVYDVDALDAALREVSYDATTLAGKCSYNYMNVPGHRSALAGLADPQVSIDPVGLTIGPRVYLRVIEGEDLLVSLRVSDSPAWRKWALAVLEATCATLTESPTIEGMQ